tara:strand:- start:5968 stop:7830 length:1863 start_codon:yes stop_codon:yes gene_type:complete
MGSGEHVSDWESLPSGEWLDNDEHGTHWYLDDEGRHWYSTDEGYRVWREEVEETPVEIPAIQRRSRSVSPSFDEVESDDNDSDDDGQDDEESEEKVPTASVGSGTAFLTMFFSMIVGVWTLGFAMPAIEDNLTVFNPSNANFVKADQILFDGFETVQMLNNLTLLLVGFMFFLSVFSLFKKIPWWSLLASNAGLFVLLFITVYTAFSSEVEWLKSCDPILMYCYQMELSPLFETDAFISAGLSFVGLIFVMNGSFNSWINFDPADEEEQQSISLIFTAPVTVGLGFLSLLIGMLMSLSVLAWTYFGSIPVTKININDNAYYPPYVEKLEFIQSLNYIAMGLAASLLLLCLVSVFKNLRWWLIPLANVLLVGLLVFTAQKSIFDGSSIVEADAFYSGCCSLLGLAIIGSATFRALSDVDWEEYAEDNDEDDYHSYSSAKSSGSYDFYDDDDDEGWRSKMKIVSLVSLFLVAGLGGFTAHYFIDPDLSADPAYAAVSDATSITNNSTDLLIEVMLLDKTLAYEKNEIGAKIMIDGSDEIWCDSSWSDSSNSACVMEWFEWDLFVQADSLWTANEILEIYENEQGLCSGSGNEVCEITVEVYSMTGSSIEDATLLTSFTMKPS